jgi:hypothetical protein
MSITGNTYLLRGEPVTVLASWRGAHPQPIELPGMQAVEAHPLRKFGPRNVLIRRANGDLVVRPFRGLRKP